MGIVYYTTIAPLDQRELSPASFVQLALDILRGGVDEPDDRYAEPGEPGSSTGWVLPPFAIRTGEWALRSELDRQAERAVPGHDTLDEQALLSAAAGDVCVWFAALDDDNEEMCTFGSGPHRGECRAGLFRRRTPVTLGETSGYTTEEERAVLDAEARHIQATCWLAVSGKHAPNAEELAASPLGRRLAKAFGELHLATSDW